MSVLGSSVMTLLDHAKRLDPDGKVARIVEILSQKNEMLEDMMWKEGNLPTGNRVTIRTKLPTVTRRLLNKGVAKSKSQSSQSDDACAIYEARSEVDVKVANLNGNASALRLSEADAFLEAMNQQVATDMIYGNAGVTQESIHGFMPRYNALSGQANSPNVIDCGGTGSDNTSGLLVVWGENTVWGTFPKGSKAGVEHEDLGIDDAFDSDNNRFRAYMDRWEWSAGLVVKDWRFVVRFANIDVSNLVSNSGAVDLIDKLISGYHQIPTFSAGKAAIYFNRTVKAALHKQARNNVQLGGQLGYEEVNGKPYMDFLKIPIRTMDALTVTEATVS